jgi:signal transduction histidine kinase
MIDMIIQPALNWAIIALSFFNLIALLWLGLTVLLNAERRMVGTWIAGGGLIICGLFFVGHTAVVGHAIETFNTAMGAWWPASWLLALSAPYLWYLGTIWYAGVWRTRAHQIGLTLTTVLGGLIVALLAFDRLPSYAAIVNDEAVEIAKPGGVPLVSLLYILYGIASFTLALAAQIRPHVTERFMGDLARTRARPWLLAATLTMTLISLAYGGVSAWFLADQAALRTVMDGFRFRAFDLLVLLLVALAVALTGRAIVSYEIFTGKTLPRGGLRRAWRRNLILAAGYGALVALCLRAPLSGISYLLLATVLMTSFFAVLSWRAYADREHTMSGLRPFVTSQRLFESVLQPAADHDRDYRAPFDALCADVLNASSAHLIALGPLAPLVGPVLSYPGGHSDPRLRVALGELIAQMRSPHTMCVQLDPTFYGDAIWAVPLWSERGLIGAILLGPKRDGALYTQEEIEIARATGERLIDTQASAELARRLMSLQRQRLAESQVVDGRVRRALHDDILPRLHTAMLLLSSEVAYSGGYGGAALADSPAHDAVELLSEMHRQIANLLYTMPAPALPAVGEHGLIGALHQTIEGELASAFDGVEWQIEPEAERAALAIPALTAEVMLYAAREAIRNAARYGRHDDPSRSLNLTVAVLWRSGLELVIEDDGVGLASTPAPDADDSCVQRRGGSGQGLALHGTMMAVVGGVLTAESAPGAYTRISLTLPQSVCEGALPTA